MRTPASSRGSRRRAAPARPTGWPRRRHTTGPCRGCPTGAPPARAGHPDHTPGASPRAHPWRTCVAMHCCCSLSRRCRCQRHMMTSDHQSVRITTTGVWVRRTNAGYDNWSCLWLKRSDIMPLSAANTADVIGGELGRSSQGWIDQQVIHTCRSWCLKHGHMQQGSRGTSSAAILSSCRKPRRATEKTSHRRPRDANALLPDVQHVTVSGSNSKTMRVNCGARGSSDTRTVTSVQHCPKVASLLTVCVGSSATTRTQP